MKKLNFKKETVAQLSPNQLDNVVGGQTYTTTQTSNPCLASEHCESVINCIVIEDPWFTQRKCIYLDTISMCGNKNN